MNPMALFVLAFGALLHQLASPQQAEPDQKHISHASDARDQPEPSATNWETDLAMSQWLEEEGKTQDRLVELGVNPKIVKEFLSEENSTASVPDWKSIKTREKTRSAVLFMPCITFTENAYLFLLQRIDNSWRVTDHSDFDCHYDDKVSFELNWIRSPSRDEVLVHHACEGHGTGYLKQVFSVYLPVDGKLKVELETSEVLHSFPTAVRVRHDLDQVSTFTVIPIANSPWRAIEQTRSSILNDHLTVERRVFRWNPTRESYEPSAFSLVEAPATN